MEIGAGLLLFIPGIGRFFMAPMRPKSEERKMVVADLLKCHFSVSNEWIGERLRMGHRSRITRAMKVYRNPPRKRRKDPERLRSILQ